MVLDILSLTRHRKSNQVYILELIPNSYFPKVTQYFMYKAQLHLQRYQLGLHTFTFTHITDVEIGFGDYVLQYVLLVKFLKECYEFKYVSFFLSTNHRYKGYLIEIITFL